MDRDREYCTYHGVDKGMGERVGGTYHGDNKERGRGRGVGVRVTYQGTRERKGSTFYGDECGRRRRNAWRRGRKCLSGVQEGMWGKEIT